MMYKYMRDNDDPQYGLLPLQDKILEIAVDIDKFCTRNNIDYCLMGGSALGAKRHGGFIPWDDDLDVFMTPDQYEKFRDCFDRTGDHGKYYLQEWGAVDGMVTIAKIRMNGTTYIEEALKDWNIHQGIFIDIWILHNCPANRFQQMRQFFWAKYVVMKGLSIRGYDRRGGFLGLALKAMKILPAKMWLKHGLKQVYKYRQEDTRLCCNFMGKAIFKTAIYPKEYFTPTELVSFEKVYLRVPANLDSFLSNRFGNYMAIPSPERIMRDQHAKVWDVNNGNQNGLDGTNDYEDERLLI